MYIRIYRGGKTGKLLISFSDCVDVSMVRFILVVGTSALLQLKIVVEDREENLIDPTYRCIRILRTFFGKHKFMRGQAFWQTSKNIRFSRNTHLQTIVSMDRNLFVGCIEDGCQNLTTYRIFY
jgi:hypothetical protein